MVFCRFCCALAQLFSLFYQGQVFSEGEPIKGVNFLLYSSDVKPEVNKIAFQVELVYS